jgi:hypothetical protein
VTGHRPGAREPQHDSRAVNPTTVVELIDHVLGDTLRTVNLIRILGACAVVLVVVIYAAVAAMKGVHVLTLPVLVPGGVVVGPSLVYWVIRGVAKLPKLRRAAAPGGLPDGQVEPSTSAASRKRARRRPKSSQGQRPRPQSGPSPRQRGQRP